MISALIRGQRASLQHIGQNMEEPIDLESRIKKAKRWLSSKWTDVDCHFIPYLIPILKSLGSQQQLFITIDGSGIGHNCSALMISVLWRRRAIPLCWMVRQVPKGHFSESMHLDVLRMAVQLLQPWCAAHCQVIFLGDGEFDGQELQQICKQHQWLYVLKTAKDTLIADNPQMEWSSKFGQIAPPGRANSYFLTDMYIFQQAYGPVHLLYWHEPKYDRPLLLITNVEYAPMAARYYRKRYHIETFFADVKSRGFHISRTKMQDPERLSNLLIVASLAFILAILFEFDARRSPHLSKFCRKDRLQSLSVFQLGLRGILFYINRHPGISFQFSNNFP